MIQNKNGDWTQQPKCLAILDSCTRAAKHRSHIKIQTPNWLEETRNQLSPTHNIICKHFTKTWGGEEGGERERER